MKLVIAIVVIAIVCASDMSCECLTCECLRELQEVEQALQMRRKMRNGGDAVAVHAVAVHAVAVQAGAERDIGTPRSGDSGISKVSGTRLPSQLQRLPSQLQRLPSQRPPSRLSPTKMEPDTGRWHVGANAG